MAEIGVQSELPRGTNLHGTHGGPTPKELPRLPNWESTAALQGTCHSDPLLQIITHIYIYSADIDVYQVYIHVYISNVIKYKYITLPDITIHYITLHYVTFCYITSHYMTLHDTTWHYTTLHIFNRTYYTHNQWDTSRWNNWVSDPSLDAQQGHLDSYGQIWCP